MRCKREVNVHKMRMPVKCKRFIPCSWLVLYVLKIHCSGSSKALRATVEIDHALPVRTSRQSYFDKRDRPMPTGLPNYFKTMNASLLHIHLIPFSTPPPPYMYTCTTIRNFPKSCSIMRQVWVNPTCRTPSSGLAWWLGLVMILKKALKEARVTIVAILLWGKIQST